MLRVALRKCRDLVHRLKIKMIPSREKFINIVRLELVVKEKVKSEKYNTWMEPPDVQIVPLIQVTKNALRTLDLVNLLCLKGWQTAR